MGNVELVRRVDMFARTEPVTSIRDEDAVTRLQPRRLADAPAPHRTSTSSEAFASTIPFALVDPDNPADTLIGMSIPVRSPRYLGLGAAAAVLTACSLVAYLAMF